MRWVGYVAFMVKIGYVYTYIQLQFVKRMHKCENNIILQVRLADD